jgi:hypothetical protein
MEETMATTITRTFAAPRPDTHQTIVSTAIAFCARFIETARQRRAERRMLLVVQEIDHPGVLADVEMTNRVQRG